MLCYSSDIDYYSPGQVGRVANCLAPFCMYKYITHEDRILYLIVHKFTDIIGGKGSSVCANSRQLGLFTPVWYSSIVSGECFPFFLNTALLINKLYTFNCTHIKYTTDKFVCMYISMKLSLKLR